MSGARGGNAPRTEVGAVNRGERRRTDRVGPGAGDRQSDGFEANGGAMAFDRNDPVRFVQQCLDTVGLEFLFNGTLAYKGKLLSAATPDQIDEYLNLERLDFGDVEDRIYLYAVKHGYRWGKGQIGPALRQLRGRARHDRRNTVLRPYLDPPSRRELADAAREWKRVSQLFEAPAALSIASLQHVIHQVKCKALGRSVDHHLMVVIWSLIQGGGKSTFTRFFCSPLRELVAQNAVLRQVADDRSAEIFQYLLILIDDIEVLEKAMADIKSILTGEELSRRTLGASSLRTIRQNATLIGTANGPPHLLLPDATGHRRFVGLPYRNGNGAKGGDVSLWLLASSINYELLWRSVDVFAPSPIHDVLDELYRYQDIGKPIDPLLKWLRGLDVHAECVREITVRAGIRARKLRELYERQTGQTISDNKFQAEMARYYTDDSTPFADQVELNIGMLYRLKPNFRNRPQANDGV